ncbi:MAG: hypothetical protein M0Q92_10495 [Methanoregula sp.]|jgi:hypothetical protein|nr:hypothetical protein [Methanoregula sp.]
MEKYKILDNLIGLLLGAGWKPGSNDCGGEMMEKMVKFADFLNQSDLKTGTISLTEGGRVHYVLTPKNEKSHLILNIVEKKGKPNIPFIATKEEIRDLAMDNVLLSDFPSYHGAFHTHGKVVTQKKTQSDAEPKPDTPEDKSVQTKEEAQISNDTQLIQQIQEMYKEKSSCKEYDVGKFNSFIAIGSKPIMARSYFCVGGRHLLYDQTFFGEKTNTIVGVEYVETEIYKKFMYESVQKSTKMSLDLGLNLKSMTPAGAAYGPAMGDPVFSNGKPLTDASGSTVKFNFDYLKTWSKLKIEAEMKLKERVQNLKIVTFPAQ